MYLELPTNYSNPLVDFSLIEICNTYNNRTYYGLFDDGHSQHYIIEGYSGRISALKKWEEFKLDMKSKYNDENDIIYSLDSINFEIIGKKEFKNIINNFDDE